MTAITAHPGGRPQWARLLLRVIGVMAFPMKVKDCDTTNAKSWPSRAFI
jgi:hypothetical protein